MDDNHGLYLDHTLEGNISMAYLHGHDFNLSRHVYHIVALPDIQLED
jgi:hypothetical protein